MLKHAVFRDFDPSDGLKRGANAPDFDDADWPAIDVPGDIHDALTKLGRIEDPFYDQNENECQWVAEREWWYRLKFNGDEQPLTAGEKLMLTFHGIDTFATIWFNGKEIERTDNMFITYQVDVSELYRFGEKNVLAVCFDPALSHVNPDVPFESWGRNVERVSLRKAQYQFGWDWGPRLITVGLWRPVEIVRRQSAYLKDVHFYTLDLSKNGDRVVVAVDVKSDGDLTYSLVANIQLGDANGDLVAEKSESLNNDGVQRIYLPIESPKLWWTHDLGEPYLYRLKVTLQQDSRVLDGFEKNVGIRTIELDQTPDTDEPGARFFRFKLNGVPIFAKGANWIPTDSLVGRLSGDVYETLLKKAQRGNFNMLRIWGGGLYEHDWFYDNCNRLGLLVWQDFMFACAMYPEAPGRFVDSIKREAEIQINRLKNEPCLALWCGNNENQWIHDKMNWSEPGTYLPGNLYYHDILPKLVEKYDGRIPYWPGSPYGGDDHNSMMDGDRHNWWTWHGDFPRRFGEEPHVDHSPDGVTYSNYAKDMGRFISEFGMHASPVPETLKRCIPEDQLWFHSPSMDFHNKDNPKNKGDNLMIPVTGLPDNLDDYIDFSMLTQAEGLKFAIEHFRRRKPHCSGTLIWQFNDCWPCLSWSVVDYYGFEKAGYHFLRRVYSPVLVSFKILDSGDVQVWATNDLLKPLKDVIEIVHERFSGKTMWQKSIEIDVPANSSQCVFIIDKSELSADEHHFLHVISEKQSFPENRQFFAAIKDAVNRNAQLRLEHKIVDDTTIQFEISAQSYAYFVHFDFAHESAEFSDNYFDIRAGSRRIITVRHDGTANAGDFLLKSL